MFKKFFLKNFIRFFVFLNLCGGVGVAKRAGLKILWLSAYAGPNPVPRIKNKQKIKWTKKIEQY